MYLCYEYLEVLISPSSLAYCHKRYQLSKTCLCPLCLHAPWSCKCRVANLVLSLFDILVHGVEVVDVRRRWPQVNGCVCQSDIQFDSAFPDQFLQTTIGSLGLAPDWWTLSSQLKFLELQLFGGNY